MFVLAGNVYKKCWGCLIRTTADFKLQDHLLTFNSDCDLELSDLLTKYYDAETRHNWFFKKKAVIVCSILKSGRAGDALLPYQSFGLGLINGLKSRLLNCKAGANTLWYFLWHHFHLYSTLKLYRKQKDKKVSLYKTFWLHLKHTNHRPTSTVWLLSLCS